MTTALCPLHCTHCSLQKHSGSEHRMTQSGQNKRHQRSLLCVHRAAVFPGICCDGHRPANRLHFWWCRAGESQTHQHQHHSTSTSTTAPAPKHQHHSTSTTAPAQRRCILSRYISLTDTLSLPLSRSHAAFASKCISLQIYLPNLILPRSLLSALALPLPPSLPSALPRCVL